MTSSSSQRVSLGSSSDIHHAANPVPTVNRHALNVYALLTKNRLGVLRHNPRTLSYEQTSVDGTRDAKRYSPLLRNLKTCFYPNWRYVRRKRGTSSVDLGIAFHRHVYHSVLCVPTDACTCFEKYGVRTQRPKHGSALHTALRQRKYFLKDYGLRPFASEVVVVSDETNVGTAVDELAWQTDENRFTKKRQELLWLISWKTGYSVAPTAARTTNGSKFMSGDSVTDVTCSAENQHHLQLLAEEKMLNENGIYPDVCVIVYVLRDTKHDTYVERFKTGGPFAHPRKADACWSAFKAFCHTRVKPRVVTNDGSVTQRVKSNFTTFIRSLRDAATRKLRSADNNKNHHTRARARHQKKTQKRTSFSYR